MTGVNSIMNIKYDKDLVKSGLESGLLTEDYKLKSSDKNKKNIDMIDMLLHKGAFGIEPCIYILGKDAMDVAKKVLKIIGGD